MRFESEAIYIMPPVGSDQAIDSTGTLSSQHAQVIPFTTGNTAAVQIVGAGFFTVTADQSVQIRHWRDNTLGNVTTSDFPLWQFAYFNWVVDGLTWVKLKGFTAPGNLYLYQSSP